jgi:GNAT superfamily N-acetyltransferase
MIKPLSSAAWKDFVSLMESDAQCVDCWCLNHRDKDSTTGPLAKERMRQLVSAGEAKGLLAYRGANCVGWISVDPINTLHGHDCQDSGKESEWSIHCIFIKDGFRTLGISTRLITAAIEYARSNGAKIISAFPIPEEHRSRFPVNEAEFSGRYSTYAKLGFVTQQSFDNFYQRMELT